MGFASETCRFADLVRRVPPKEIMLQCAVEEAHTMKTVLVGTYTTGTESEGIYRLREDDQGRFGEIELALRSHDASYLLPVKGGLYFVDEALGEKEGRVSYARKTEAGYELVTTLPTGGENPCHLALSPSGNTLAVANYTSGSVALFTARGEGLEQLALIPGEHGSVNVVRQEGPHAHFVAFEGEDTLYVSDLGADEIRTIRRIEGTWRAFAPVHVFAPGAGPRHFVRRGNVWYVICEMGNVLYRLSPGEETVLPVTDSGVPGTSAAVRLGEDGGIYCTQRGADVLTVFRDDAEGLRREGIWPAGGRTPRDCLPMGNRILCACQDSAEVTVLERIQQDIRLRQRIAVPGAVCLAEE